MHRAFCPDSGCCSLYLLGSHGPVGLQMSLLMRLGRRFVPEVGRLDEGRSRFAAITQFRQLDAMTRRLVLRSGRLVVGLVGQDEALFTHLDDVVQ